MTRTTIEKIVDMAKSIIWAAVICLAVWIVC